jgi:predicted DNA-binding ribbon-helix-helix protein
MARKLEVIDEAKTVRTSVTLDVEDHDELQRMAKRRKVSLAWMIRHAVERLLESENPLFKKRE